MPLGVDCARDAMVCRCTPKYQRTYVNTEACYLAIKHAFEHLRYRRVEWKCGTHTHTHTHTLTHIHAHAVLGGNRGCH
jgi:hypothetical protein